MKTLRLLPALVASCLFVAVSVGLQATATPLIWVGGLNSEGDPNDVTYPGNWTNGTFSGDGDDVSFGDTGTRQVYVGSDISVGSVSFGNGSSNRIDFHGDGEGSSLYLFGDLTADPGSTARFNSDLNLLLTTAHTANIGEGAKIEFGSDIDEWDGVGSINKTGTGTLVLSGYNTFSGGVSVHDAGVLALGTDSDHSDGLLASAVGTGTLKLYSGSTLSMTDDTEHAFTLYNDIDLDCSGGTVTVNLGSASKLTLESYISGAAGLDKRGTGTLVLGNGSNDFSGGVSVHEGTLLLGASSTAVEGIAGPVGSGGLKLYDGTTLGVSTTNAVTLHNNIELDCRSTANVTVQTQNSQSLTLAGDISGSAELTKTGAGTLTLTGDNTFTGDLYVNGGTLNLGSNTAAGQGALELGVSSGTVNFTTSAPVIHGLSADLGTDTLNVLAASTLTVDQEGNSTFAGQIVEAGAGANLVKAGRGSLTLSHSNNYSGTTTISGGTLVYGANLAFGSSTVVINGGALKIANGATFSNNLTLTSGKLAGNFSFTTPQTFGTGVTLSPGNSPGTINFTSLTVNDGLATDFEFNAATDTPGVSSDLIAVSGTLDLSAVSAGGYTLRLISLMSDNNPGAVTGLTGPASWTIFTTGTLTGFANGGTQFTIDSTQFYGGGIFTISQSGQNLLLNFTPVPEPSTYALMALGLLTTGAAAWRKRRRA